MKIETCNKCGDEVMKDRKLDNNIWSCPNCGLEEYQSQNSPTNEVNKDSDKSKHFLNKEQTVVLTLSKGTATIEGHGKIDKELWDNLKSELNLKKYIIEIKENVQLPDDCSSLFECFGKEIIIHPNIDISNVKTMRQMFFDAKLANPDTSNWDTSNVTDMGAMFCSATSANPDTSKWDTSNVTNMEFMFSCATSANPDTSNWNVAKVEDMGGMFYGSAYTGKSL